MEDEKEPPQGGSFFCFISQGCRFPAGDKRTMRFEAEFCERQKALSQAVFEYEGFKSEDASEAYLHRVIREWQIRASLFQNEVAKRSRREYLGIAQST